MVWLLLFGDGHCVHVRAKILEPRAHFARNRVNRLQVFVGIVAEGKLHCQGDCFHLMLLEGGTRPEEPPSGRVAADATFSPWALPGASRTYRASPRSPDASASAPIPS